MVIWEMSVETNDGEIITGIVARETNTEVFIQNANNVNRTIQRGQIKEMSASGLSLMPEELESGMDHQTMADLIAFLQKQK